MNDDFGWNDDSIKMIHLIHTCADIVDERRKSKAPPNRSTDIQQGAVATMEKRATMGRNAKQAGWFTLSSHTGALYKNIMGYQQPPRKERLDV